MCIVALPILAGLRTQVIIVYGPWTMRATNCYVEGVPSLSDLGRFCGNS